MSIGYIGTASGNLLDQPASDGLVLAVLARGTEVDVRVADDSGWLLVLATAPDGHERLGYVAADCVQAAPINKPVQVPPTNDDRGLPASQLRPPGAPIGPGPDFPEGFAEALAAITFLSAKELNNFFIRRTNKTFIGWFNSNVAGNGSWKGLSIVPGPIAESNFENFWNSFGADHKFSLIEFASYMSIFVNEVSGNLISITEGYKGYPDHPGVAYFFDSFLLKNGRHKASYNRPPNMLAFDCFNDPDFNAAHGVLAGNALKGTIDPVWRQQVFPQNSANTSVDSRSNDYIMQADFFKFRGRGLIQTTWRNNYKSIVEYINNYTGNNALVKSFQEKWANLSADTICTVSRTVEWDTLFEQSENTIVTAAIRLHAKNGNYIPLSAKTSVLNGVGPGSIYFMGQSIAGGTEYPPIFKARVFQIFATIFK